MIEIHLCEAPVHTPSCNGIATSIDHFTPRCIGKLLGWSKKQIDSDENKQWLSQPCHASKDRTTPAKLQQVKFQLRGGSINFGQHL